MQSEQQTDQPLSINLKIISKNLKNLEESVETSFPLNEGKVIYWPDFFDKIGNMADYRGDTVWKIYKAEGRDNPITMVTNRIHFELICFNNKIKITNQKLVGYEFDDLDLKYVIEIRPRVSERQNENLICDALPNELVNVLVFRDGVPVIYSSIRSLASIFADDLSVDFYVDGNYVKINLSELCKNRIVAKYNRQVSYSLKNYMCFRVSNSLFKRESLPADMSMLEAFNSELKGSGSFERNRLWGYINMANSLEKKNLDRFYAPIINVCQSSGSGKSKIAKELMDYGPSAYFALKDEKELGFPTAGQMSDMFLFNYEFPDNVIINYYGILLNEILAHYLERLKYFANAENHQEENSSKRVKLNSFDEFLKDISEDFIMGKFLTDIVSPFQILSQLARGIVDIDPRTRKVELNPKPIVFFREDSLRDACRFHLKAILDLASSLQGKRIDLFLFILDEASLMTESFSINNTNLYRLFRKSLNRYFCKTEFFVLSLGADSEVLDPNLKLSFSSLQEQQNYHQKLFPPFILSRNWDILLDFEDLQKNNIGYDSLQCGRISLFHVSLGRPLFSSIALACIPDLAFFKLTNNNSESEDVLLACWMIRVGLTVNPFHVVCKHLSKYHMARVIFITENLQSWRIDYPSEPTLAYTARLLVHDMCELPGKPSRCLRLIPYYQKLEHYVRSRAVDSRRICEIIYGDILLQAVMKSDRIHMKTWLFVEGLPKICKKRSFLLKDDEEPSGRGADKDNVIRDAFQYFDFSITLDSFVKAKYSNDIYEDLKKFIAPLLQSALMNASHFVQMNRKFPIETVLPGESMKGPVADFRYEGSTEPCDMITQETLGTGIMRSNAFMAPPNYFGLDLFLPICLDPDEVAGRSSRNPPIVVSKRTFSNSNTTPLPDNLEAEFNIRREPPTYSYIGCQVKKASSNENVRKVVADCAISNHLVRCAAHQNCSQECIHRPKTEVCPEHINDESPCGTNCQFRPMNISCQFHQNCSLEMNCCRRHLNCDENCRNRIPDQSYSEILGNGLAFLHEMTANPLSQRASDVNIVEIRNELLWKCRDELVSSTDSATSQAVSEELKAARDLFCQLCPTWGPFNEILSNCVEKKRLKSKFLVGSRFIPDIYAAKTFSKFLKVHFMAKRHPDTGLIERLTVIESRGLEVFNNFLPENVAQIANRIIFNEISIFDELEPQRGSIKFDELVQSVVHSNNDSKIPLASNLIRNSLGKPSIPDSIPEYA